MPVHIPGRLDEHAAGAAGGVQELLVAGLGVQHLHHVADDRCGGIERAAVPALRQGEVAQEVFIDLTEDIYGAVLGDVLEDADDPRNVLEDADDPRKELRLLLRDQLSVA